MYNNLHQVYSTSFEDFADKDSAWLRSTLIKKQHELNAIIQGSKAILGKSNFTDTAREIFDQCCDLIGATSGYVALLSEDGSENDVLFLEDGGMECTVDPELPMPIRGLRAESYSGNCAVYHNDFMNSPWVEMMPGGHMTLNNVMFSPLVIDDKTVGIMGMANKSSDFTDRDADIATVFGELAAIALQNSRFLEARQEAEDRLSQTVYELKDAQKLAKTGSWELDLSQGTLSWSDEVYRIFGLNPQEFSATYDNFLNNIHPEDRDYVNREYLESVENKQPYSIIHRLLLADGTLKYVNERCETLYDEDNKAIRSLGTIQDITETIQAEQKRQMLEEQLRQKQKMEAVGYMAGGMAHNFNNNLSIILGNIELSQMKQPSGSEAIPLLENAKIAVRRSRDLILKIITYSRKGIQNKTPIQLADIINETMELLQSTLPSTINFQSHINPKSLSAVVNADPSQVQEILINLCNNAVRAMNEKGDLHINLDSVELNKKDIPAQYDEALPGSYVKLGVQDTGCGMTTEMISKIFDPFFSTKEEYEGAGMGLATGQGIVAQHKGLIKVNSIPDQGTVFDLYFPIVEEEAAETESINTETPEGEEKILFVDDDEQLATIGEQLLSGKGYQVTMMTDSLEALKLFKANPDHFDLVITDQTMPDLTGEELIQELKKIRPDLKTILSTGYSTKIDEEQAKQQGIDAFCMKPLDLPELLQTMRRILEENKE